MGEDSQEAIRVDNRRLAAVTFWSAIPDAGYVLKPGSAAALRPCALGASGRNESVGEAVWRCPCYEGLCVCAFLPAAFQPPCCLPQPWTKHIAATEQHGILSYLPAAAAVLAPDAPVLSCTRCRR